MKVAYIIGSEISEKVFTTYLETLSNSGAWVYTQLFYLSECDDVEKIVVVSVHRKYLKDYSFKKGKFSVYQIRGDCLSLRIDKNLFKKIDNIMVLEEPDVIDIQGVETTLSGYPRYASSKIKMINTLHGLSHQIWKFYLTGLPLKSILLDRTLHDNLTMHGILESKYLMKKRAINEIKLLKNIKYVSGRTEWDKICAITINPNLCYFKNELILRDVFYSSKWELKNAKRNRIFATQMRIPYKGLFIFLEAIEIVRNVYPDIEVHIPGNKLRNKIKRNGYEKLILRQLDKKDLNSNIYFIGNLNASQMVQELLEARVFVIPSLIENSSNSLAEAQLIGTPCVAAVAGGVSEYVNDEQTGLLYNSIDPLMCAERIIRLLGNDQLSANISINSRKLASKRHDPQEIIKSLIKTYKQIMV